MTDATDDAFDTFLQTMLSNLSKNGFPERRVAFPLERMYELAYAKGLNFNRVLEALAAQGIDHEKTPEKVIFQRAEAGSAAADPFAGLDMSQLSGLPPDQVLSAAAQAMQQMSPEQVEALKAMVEGMSNDEREQMLEQARRMGLL